MMAVFQQETSLLNHNSVDSDTNSNSYMTETFKEP